MFDMESGEGPVRCDRPKYADIGPGLKSSGEPDVREDRNDHAHRHETDLNRKQWDWQTGGSIDVVIVKQHPDQLLPMVMRARRPFAKIEMTDDRFSRRIDYYRYA